MGAPRNRSGEAIRSSRSQAGREKNGPQLQRRERERWATNAVAAAFAKVIAERYPGTSWLPVQRDGGGRSLSVPTRKVVRLLPGPADQDTLTGIGDAATPAANGRAPDEHSADSGAQ